MNSGEREMVKATRREFTRALLAWEANDCLGLPQFVKSLGIKPVHLPDLEKLLAELTGADPGRR